ncbi:MAG: N-acetylmuramoyl-L-alanine amidase [Bradymonadia bacterium]
MLKILPILVLCFASAAQAETGLGHVVIDPGHGGENKGAPARFIKGGFEKKYTLVIAEHVAGMLREAGVPKVTLTRTTDTDMSLADRVMLANRVEADVLVSIHLNSSERAGAAGHEVYFLSLRATDEAAERLARYESLETGEALAPAPRSDDPVKAILDDLTQSRAHQDAETLAGVISAQLAKHSPFPNRGVKQAPFIVLMGAHMPAVVVEVGFLNHYKEGRYVTREPGMTTVARAIADGVLDYGRRVAKHRRRHTTKASTSNEATTQEPRSEEPVHVSQ